MNLITIDRHSPRMDSEPLTPVRARELLAEPDMLMLDEDREVLREIAGMTPGEEAAPQRCGLCGDPGGEFKNGLCRSCWSDEVNA